MTALLAAEAGGCSGHQLERFLARVLSCLFGEDTGIFERESFKLYLLNRTARDGSDLGLRPACLGMAFPSTQFFGGGKSSAPRWPGRGL